MTFVEVQGKTNGKQNVAMVKSVNGSETSHTTSKPNSKAGKKYIEWGDSDKFPTTLAKAVRKNGSASSAMRVKERTHYGNGLTLYKNSKSETGKKVVEFVPIDEEPVIEAFLKKIRYKLFLQETIKDLEWFNVAFPEFVLSVDRKSIASVRRQKTAWCRYAAPNNKGFVDKIYVSSKFGNVSNIDIEDTEYVSEIPLINPYLTKEEIIEYCIEKNIDRFTIPFGYPVSDESFYPEADWHSILNSGWLEVANSVPEYKLNIFKNQVSIKYIIEIDERYFEKLYYQEWEKYDLEKKLSIRKKLIEAITDELSGNTNSGKSISSIMFADAKDQQISAVKITPIDDKFKDGSYLPEAEAANSEVLFAMGVDPSVIGAGIPGGKLGAGSGSDKRVAFNIMQALKTPDRDVSLSVLEFIQDFNNWNPKIKFAYENTEITTLDKNPTSTQNGI
ncbi:hypothetical protein F0460_13255 [Paenimyroides baculatum]|uniref:Phage portal protein n=1 Tax=Paenimyroides baculatum TaxID=2608000 RepID=A0A5M6CIC9_9FLAO|nr:hypothetical protein F0460_13255 [Paenimyroides baculatum]